MIQHVSFTAMNPEEEERIRQFLLEDEIGASDDSDEDDVEESDHHSESEQSADEQGHFEEEDMVEEEEIIEPDPMENFIGNSNDLYIAQDGTQWRIAPQENLRARRRRCDLLRHLPGVRGEARNANSPIEALQLFFNDEMLESFVASTNIYIASIRHKYSRPRDACDTNLVELKACLGLLFLAGCITYKTRGSLEC